VGNNKIMRDKIYFFAFSKNYTGILVKIYKFFAKNALNIESLIVDEKNINT
jgi:hypothetical protein